MIEDPLAAILLERRRDERAVLAHGWRKAADERGEACARLVLLLLLLLLLCRCGCGESLAE